jgi:hypothetical protein
LKRNRHESPTTATIAAEIGTSQRSKKPLPALYGVLIERMTIAATPYASATRFTSHPLTPRLKAPVACQPRCRAISTANTTSWNGT